MQKACYTVLWILLSSTTAAAQTMSGVPVVDSAAVARAAWARANAHVRAGELSAARRELERAVRAWPSQPAYRFGYARLAAMTRDTAALANALNAYAELGLGRDLRNDSLFRPLLDNPRVDSAVKRLLALNEPVPRATQRLLVADTTIWPEAFDYDPRTRRYYIASIQYGTVVVVHADGTTADLWPRDLYKGSSVMAVRIDPRRNSLWAALSAAPIGVTGAEMRAKGEAVLLQVRLSDGTLLRRWDFSAPDQEQTLGDVELTAEGDVLITDSSQPWLYVVDPDRDGFARYTHPLFRSLQGIAVAPGGIVYLADYSHGLLRFDRKTSTTTRLAEPSGTTSLGLDGIAWYRGSIVGVQNGVAPARIVQLELDQSGESIRALRTIDRHPAAEDPTTGKVIDGEFVYVATSHWINYNGAMRTRVPRRPVVLLGVVLDSRGPLSSPTGLSAPAIDTAQIDFASVMFSSVVFSVSMRR